MNYSSLILALKATGIPFAEYAWQNAPQSSSYGVISIDMTASTIWADGGLTERTFEGSVDLFVRGNPRTDFRTVDGVLKASGLPFRLNSAQYEDDTGLLHYEWTFEVEDGAV